MNLQRNIRILTIFSQTQILGLIFWFITALTEFFVGFYNRCGGFGVHNKHYKNLIQLQVIFKEVIFPSVTLYFQC